MTETPAPAFQSTHPVVAVVGGGQLARMMQQAAISLEIDLRALVEAADGSTGLVDPDSAVGAADDLRDVQGIAQGADVLTFEHEHVPPLLLSDLEDRGIVIRPSRQALNYAQDKLDMRRRLTRLGIPCPRWAAVSRIDDVAAFGDEVGWPIVLKQPVGGYDGHGVRIVHTAEEAADWLDGGTAILAEEKVPFTSEAAALLARRPSGEIRQWPVAQSIQEDGVCAVVLAPAPTLSEAVAAQAQEIAARIATELDVTGVLAVELFVVGDPADGSQHVLVNELAMRPHNTGHWTIDGSVTSQFEQHLRAVLDLPLGDTAMRAPAAVMVNLLGSDWDDPAQGLPAALAAAPEAKVHLYGKGVRPGRKLGHVTACAPTAEQARALATSSMEKLKHRPQEA